MILLDKNVLLTGGSAGIGKELAILLKREGANVTLTGRNTKRLVEMENQGFQVIEADLSTEKGVNNLISQIDSLEFDILINNAGQSVDHDFRVKIPNPLSADRCIYANLQAPIKLITSLVPRLSERPEAAIVNVTSGLAIAPRAAGPIYCATKAGLRSYTMALRKQLEKTNIDVIEILPPVVETQMTAGQNHSKMSPVTCAEHIIRAIKNSVDEAYIGQTNVLRWVFSISPKLAQKIMLRF